MQSLLNCIRVRVGSEPGFAAGTGQQRGQGLGNGVRWLHGTQALASPGVEGWAGGEGEERRRGDWDVWSRYLTNQSSNLVLVAGFCCRARQLENLKEIKFSLQSNRFFHSSFVTACSKGIFSYSKHMLIIAL